MSMYSGAFTLYAVPDIKNRNDERLNELSDIITNLSAYTLNILKQECAVVLFDLNDQEIRDTVLEHLLVYWDLTSDDDYRCGSMHLPGCDVDWLFTGGYWDGEQPTDLCDTFYLLSCCGPVVNAMEIFAANDLLEKIEKA